LFAVCSGTGELVKQRGVGSRPNVYREVQDTTSVPPGYADPGISLLMNGKLLETGKRIRFKDDLGSQRGELWGQKR